MSKKKEPEHLTTQSAEAWTKHLANSVREAGGGRNKKGQFRSSRDIVDHAAEDHYRIIEEANRNRGKNRDR